MSKNKKTSTPLYLSDSIKNYVKGASSASSKTMNGFISDLIKDHKIRSDKASDLTILDHERFFELKKNIDSYLYIGQINDKDGDMLGWSICARVGTDGKERFNRFVYGSEDKGVILIFSSVDDAINQLYEYFWTDMRVHYCDDFCLEVDKKKTQYLQ